MPLSRGCRGICAINQRVIYTILAAILCVVCYAVLHFLLNPWLALLTTVVLALMELAYVRTLPKPLGNRRPNWSFFPKYGFTINLDQDLSTAEDTALSITERLESFGFRLEQENRKLLKFSRGHPKGDFSIELAHVNLNLFLPLSEPTNATMQYGWFCAFDTGDLWQLTQQVKNALEGKNS